MSNKILIAVLAAVAVGAGAYLWTVGSTEEQPLLEPSGTPQPGEASPPEAQLVEAAKPPAGAAQAQDSASATAASADEAAVASLEQRLAQRMGNFSIEELKMEQHGVLQAYDARMEAVVSNHFDSGRYEVLTGDAARLPAKQDGPLAAYRLHDNETWRTLITREDYPEIYELKDTSNWIDAELKRREQQR